MKHFSNEKYEAIIKDDYEAFGKAAYEAKQIPFICAKRALWRQPLHIRSMLHKFRKEFASLSCNL